MKFNAHNVVGWGIILKLVAWIDGPLNDCPECAQWDEWAEVEDLKEELDLIANRKRSSSLNLMDARPEKERRVSKAWWLEGVDTDRESMIKIRYLRFVTMPDNKRCDGRYRIPGDLDWASDNGIDINDPVALARWYGVSLEEYLTGQEWDDENLQKIRSIE